MPGFVSMWMLECPGCGQAGPGNRDESAFDFIDRDELLALRRCRRCATVLLVRFTLFPTEAHTEVIPADVWEAMEEARSMPPVRSMTLPAPPS